jgi:CheY-like chemotaxis protein
VESGEEALALLDMEPFDVVLSDLHMPGMNGLALTRAIRERTGLNRSVPVIALSGADSPDDQAACRAAGMRACVSKPIDPAPAYQAIEEACAGVRRPRTGRTWPDQLALKPLKAAARAS